MGDRVFWHYVERMKNARSPRLGRQFGEAGHLGHHGSVVHRCLYFGEQGHGARQSAGPRAVHSFSLRS